VTEDAGRGVGLDAVETAVREAGGTIEASSEKGRGTTFLIRFTAADENFQN
jgi:chemotaxis protein histidine kinase CheA